MLKWVFERCDGKVHAKETPLGWLPDPADIDTKGLNLPAEKLAKLLDVDIQGWQNEVPSIRQHFAKFGDRLPKGLNDELAGLEQRLKAAKK